MKNSTVLVTGANRGYGLVVVRDLVEKGEVGRIIVGVRDLGRWAEAAKTLPPSPHTHIEAVAVDLEKTESVRDFVKELKNRGFTVDTLLNNAALINEGTGDAKKTFAINFFNTVLLTQELLAHGLINEGGRVINVASIVGCSRMFVDQALAGRLRAAELPEVTELAHEIATRIDEKGQLFDVIKKDHIFPIYSVTKLFLNRFTELLAKDPRIVQKRIGVYAYHPGYLSTHADYTDGLDPKEGVPILYYLMALPFEKKEIQGHFFGRDRMVKDIWDPNFDYNSFQK